MTIKDRFCAKCGKKTAQLAESLCSDCYLVLNKIKLPKQKHMLFCPHCKSAWIDNFWLKLDSTPEKEMEQLIARNLELPEKVKLTNIKITKLAKDGSIKLTLKFLNSIITIEEPIRLGLRYKSCPNCKVQSRTTHQAKIQLRAKTDFKNFISAIMAELPKYRKHILKLEEQKRGVDVYFVDKMMAKRIANELKVKFECRMSETSSAYSWNKAKSKPKYRSTILLQQR